MTDAVLAPRRPAGWGWFLASVVAALLIWRVHDLLLVAFLAVLLAVYLGGFTDKWQRRVPRLPRGVALVFSLLLTLTALAGIGFLLAPAVASQTQDLLTAVPRYLTALDDMARRIAASSDVFRRSGIASAQTGVVTTAVNDSLEFIRRSFFAYAAGTGMVIIDGVAVIAMGLYLSWHPGPYLAGLLQVVPPRHRVAARAIASDLGDTLRAWVGAQMLAMVVLALATAIGLLILDVPYWLAFSIFAGVAVMVPFFGSITSTLLPALLVLPDRGPLTAFAVAMVGVVVHVLEANLVHPLIMQHRVALPPALTILSVLIMGALTGLLGMLVAVPLLASVIVLVRHILIYQTYGEQPEGQPVVHAVLRASREMPAVQPAR